MEAGAEAAAAGEVVAGVEGATEAAGFLALLRVREMRLAIAQGVEIGREQIKVSETKTRDSAVRFPEIDDAPNGQIGLNRGVWTGQAGC